MQHRQTPVSGDVRFMGVLCKFTSHNSWAHVCHSGPRNTKIATLRRGPFHTSTRCSLAQSSWSHHTCTCSASLATCSSPCHFQNRNYHFQPAEVSPTILPVPVSVRSAVHSVQKSPIIKPEHASLLLVTVYLPSAEAVLDLLLRRSENISKVKTYLFETALITTA